MVFSTEQSCPCLYVAIVGNYEVGRQPIPAVAFQFNRDQITHIAVVEGQRGVRGAELVVLLLGDRHGGWKGLGSGGSKRINLSQTGGNSRVHVGHTRERKPWAMTIYSISGVPAVPMLHFVSGVRGSERCERVRIAQ